MFWNKVFTKIKKDFPGITHLLLDFSAIPVTSANLLQVLYRNSPLKDTKLTLSHKDFSINKIKLMDTAQEDSSDFSEDDLAEPLFPKKQIEETKDV